MRIKPTTLLSIYLIFGLVASLFILKHNYFMEIDSCVHAICGKNLVNGLGYTYSGKPQLWHNPFYPLLIGILYKIIDNLELAPPQRKDLNLTAFELGRKRYGTYIYNRN